MCCRLFRRLLVLRLAALPLLVVLLLPLAGRPRLWVAQQLGQRVQPRPELLPGVPRRVAPARRPSAAQRIR